MNIVKSISIAVGILLVFTLCSSNNESTKPTEPVYDIKINSLAGDPINLNDFKGKNVLFVNVASECGFTPQYADLQSLSEKYPENLVIIGLPCNQFGGQEPGTATEIESFCSANYGVEFLMSEKIDVKGDKQHPLYAWLTEKDLNGVENSSVKWNFQKYLVDENGNYIDVWYSSTNPLSEKITKYLNE